MSKKKDLTQEEVGELTKDCYCPVCGTCGYIGCCGVRKFLEKHVRGKTDCPQEALMIDEIISYVEDQE